MTYQPPAIAEDLSTLPKLPAWVTSARLETSENVAFQSGAALTVLDALLSDPAHGVPLKLLANRLALKAATATSKLEGRMAREADIRDAYHLTPPGEARGPDGDLLAFWRAAVQLRLTGRDWQSGLKGVVGPDFADDVAGWIEAGVVRAKTHGPLAGCLSVMRTVMAADDRAERIACLLSDIVLARTLGWPSLLPITAQYLTKAMLRDLVAEGQGAELKVQQRILESVEDTIRIARPLIQSSGAPGHCPETPCQGIGSGRRAVPVRGCRGTINDVVADDPGHHHSDDGPCRAPVLRPVGGTRCCTRIDRTADLPTLRDRAMTAVVQSRKTKRGQGSSSGDGLFDRELADLPQDLRWREWMGRIEAVLFASVSPVGREDLARVVGQGASVEMLIADIQAELTGRPYELVQVAGGWMFRTRAQFAEAITAAADLGEQSLAFTEMEMGVLCAIAYHQPIDRAGLKDIFGKDVSRDLLARLRHKDLIASGPRAPRPGAPHTFVTTLEFLATFDLQTLRDLPDLELRN